MKITLTYDRLVKSDEALAKIGKLKGLPGDDKMFFAKQRRLLAADLMDIEEQRIEIAKKYLDIGHARLKQDVLDRSEAMPPGPKKDLAIKAASKIAKPNQVLQPEMPDYQLEYEKLLKAEVTVEVPKIQLSKLIEHETILPEDLFALDWLTEDDVTNNAKRPAPAKAGKKPRATAENDSQLASDQT